MFNVACIGSREISREMEQKLQKIGRFIAQQGWDVYSGNALGSDVSYATGANEVNPNAVKLFQPWQTYNSEHFAIGNVIISKHEPEWVEIARRHHPIYDKLTQGAKKMMDRNAGIIINSQAVCAVLNHSKPGFGGTGHGWRIAEEFKRPRIDLSSLEKGLTVEEVCEWLKKVKEKLENPLTSV